MNKHRGHAWGDNSALWDQQPLEPSPHPSLGCQVSHRRVRSRELGPGFHCTVLPSRVMGADVNIPLLIPPLSAQVIGNGCSSGTRPVFGPRQARKLYICGVVMAVVGDRGVPSSRHSHACLGAARHAPLGWLPCSGALTPFLEADRWCQKILLWVTTSCVDHGQDRSPGSQYR